MDASIDAAVESFDVEEKISFGRHAKRWLTEAGTGYVSGWIFYGPLEMIRTGWEYTKHERNTMGVLALLGMAKAYGSCRESWMRAFDVTPESPKYKQFLHDFAYNSAFFNPIYMATLYANGIPPEEVLQLVIWGAAISVIAGPGYGLIRDFGFKKIGEPATLQAEGKGLNTKAAHWFNLPMTEATRTLFTCRTIREANKDLPVNYEGGLLTRILKTDLYTPRSLEAAVQAV